MTKTLTPGAGFRRKFAIPPQGALSRVAAPPRGEWRCAHSPQRPASAAAAVTREHFAWRLADSAGGMRGGDDGVPAAMAACAVADSVMNGCSGAEGAGGGGGGGKYATRSVRGKFAHRPAP